MGTDDNLVLSNAMLSELPDAIRLTCKIQKQDNVKKKLQAMKISTPREGEILKYIFGKVTGGTLFHGLYHSKNPDALDQKLADLHRKWETLAPAFFSWFQKEEADTFKTSMIESVRRAAQVKDDFTMNASKSLNEELKSWVDRRVDRRVPGQASTRSLKILEQPRRVRQKKQSMGVGSMSMS